MGINIYFLTKDHLPNATKLITGKVVRIGCLGRHTAIVCFTDNPRSFAYVNMSIHNAKWAELNRRSPLLENLLKRVYRGNPPPMLAFNTIANMIPTMLECEITAALQDTLPFKTV